jgi:REP element-mobilizing transposase RayT
METSILTSGYARDTDHRPYRKGASSRYAREPNQSRDRKGAFFKRTNQSRDRKGALQFEQYTVTYLITFACYGCHLHGGESGSVDSGHNAHGTPILEADSARAAAEAERMDQPPYYLDQIRRDAVLVSIKAVCTHRGWSLLAAHARSNHVHIVVEAEQPPERVMSDFKVYASRQLNGMQLDHPNRKRWARHGSTRWLWKPKHVSAAIEYVIAEQGRDMSVFESHEL